MTHEFVVLQISDVAHLLRATRFTLDQLVRRCNLRPVAVRRRKWTRVVFTLEDVGPLALAYWLFRSGLRTKAIQDVLSNKAVEGLLQKLISPEAMEAESEAARFLVTWRVPKPSTSGTRRRKEFGQKVALTCGYEDVRATLEEPDQFGFLVVPLGRLLRELANRVRQFMQEIKEGENSVNL